MYDFLVNNSIFVVLIIALIIWVGISFYLLNIDKKISKLEILFNKNNEIKDKN